MYRYILGGIILICLVLFFVQNVSSITGHATEDSTYSEVTIQSYLAINFCDNLSTGILFGDVISLPATNINGSHNYDGTSSASTYCILVSEDSNTAVDFCLKADDDLISPGADRIGLSNETYANSTTSDLATPALANEVPLTTSYVKSSSSISVGGTNYYRFWLDIPGGQATGTYNNTVSFKGVNTGNACGS